MTRVETVLIGTDEPYAAVARRVAELLSPRSDRSASSDVFSLARGGWAELDAESFDPWTGRRLAAFRWQLVIGGIDAAGEQEAAAREVFELLAAHTSWALALAFDHTDRIAATRPSRDAPSRAAG